MNKIERHPQRAAIERALAGAQTLAEIGSQYGLSVETLCRHRARLRKKQPAYFASLKFPAMTPREHQMVAALVELSQAMQRITNILSTP